VTLAHRIAVFLAALTTACAHHSVVDDGTSVSYGNPRQGVLINPVRLPDAGDGYYTPSRWGQRGLRYGTEELVSLIVWAGRELVRLHPGAAFAVADLSLARGGPSAWHRSHQHGRDVDIPFITRTGAGEARRTMAMHRFSAAGMLVGAAPEEPVPGSATVFDDERNWTLIKLLLENPIIEIQWIFVSDDLKQRLIEHAIAAGEPADLIARAGYLLHQPGDSLPHDDHFHIRVFCPPSDLAFGCEDWGAIRWVKKTYKYERRPRRAGAARLLSLLHRAPGVLLVAIGAIPARGFVLK
jgi:penicillin-insensitive murein endopeptidase